MAGIYLHIPFCKKRCIYCGFYSTTKSMLMDEYVAAVCRELQERKNYLFETVKTIYFGGGTPSLLQEEHFKQIFQTIKDNYTITDDAEITLEANPDDLSPEYVTMLRKFPFNRLSIGIQTFNDTILKKLNRRHKSRQAIEAFQRCRQAGFDNISIDLIYGFPGENLEAWEKDLQTAFSMKPEHISAYSLTYEPGTKLWELREDHKIEELDEDTSILLFKQLMKRMKENGYEHYEISNFCLPGRHSRHNSSYWTGESYLGCGAAAHSYNGYARRWNVKSLERYIDRVNAGGEYYDEEHLNIDSRYNDYVITSLRTRHGIDLEKLKSLYGDLFYNYCLKMAMPHLQQNTLEINGDGLRTTYSGIFITDYIISDLIWID